MYVVNEIYNYPDPDNEPMDTTYPIAHTNTEEEANEILKLRCQFLREKRIHPPIGRGWCDGGCYLMNDLSLEESAKLKPEWDSWYTVEVEEVKTTTPKEYLESLKGQR